MGCDKKKKNDDVLHYGILGMKWGIRRFQNPDGSLTDDGRERYGTHTKNDEAHAKLPGSKETSEILMSRFGASGFLAKEGAALIKLARLESPSAEEKWTPIADKLSDWSLKMVRNDPEFKRGNQILASLDSKLDKYDKDAWTKAAEISIQYRQKLQDVLQELGLGDKYRGCSWIEAVYDVRELQAIIMPGSDTREDDEYEADALRMIEKM